MVSIQTFIAVGSAILAAATTASAAYPAARINAVKRVENICGTMPAPGIRKPAEGDTIIYTAEQQKNYDPAIFEVIYCSGDYFKTASLNATALLGDSTSTGMIIGSASNPTPGVASAGYYGYVFNVSVGPISGNYITGSKKLSVFEWERGYYNAYNFNVKSVTINFEKEATN